MISRSPPPFCFQTLLPLVRFHKLPQREPLNDSVFGITGIANTPVNSDLRAAKFAAWVRKVAHTKKLAPMRTPEAKKKGSYSRTHAREERPSIHRHFYFKAGVQVTGNKIVSATLFLTNTKLKRNCLDVSMCQSYTYKSPRSYPRFESRDLSSFQKWRASREYTLPKSHTARDPSYFVLWVT